jgi:hypothetical protein
MNLKDVLEVSAAVIASLGGAGAIVFGLSSYLGKVWAERGLAEQRQKYEQLNIAFSNQLDIATRRIQIELDALGHLHKLRTQAEFERMQELWKALSALRIAIDILPDKTQHNAESLNVLEYLIQNRSLELAERISEAQSILDDHTLLIPKDIADLANQTVELARDELDFQQWRAVYEKEGSNNRPKLLNNTRKLEMMMRQYLHGEGAEDASPKAS